MKKLPIVIKTICLWGWGGVLVFCGLTFAAACLAFSFPLTYCDSPGWAPDLFTTLTSTQSPTWIRGFNIVTLWYLLLGKLTLIAKAGFVIGIAQALLLYSLFIVVVKKLSWQVLPIDLILLPLFFVSCLRIAIYSQTIFSEPVIITLHTILCMLVLCPRISLFGSFMTGFVSASLLASRMDALPMIALALAYHLFVQSLSAKRKWHIVVLATSVVITHSVMIFLGRNYPAPTPLVKIQILGEWSRYTELPSNALAEKFFDAHTETILDKSRNPKVRDVRDGINVGTYMVYYTNFSLKDLLKFIFYQTTNKPKVIFFDRLRSFIDYFNLTYSAFVPEYHAKAVFFWPYEKVFAQWTVDDFNNLRYSCPVYAQAFEKFFERKQVRSSTAVTLLSFFHRTVKLYAWWIIRPLLWLSLLWNVCQLLQRRFNSEQMLLFGTLIVSLAFRAVFNYPDERYQLPLELISSWWIVLSVRSFYVALLQFAKNLLNQAKFMR